MTEQGVEGPVMETATPVVQDVAPVSDEQELGAIWDRVERDNGAARSPDGKFASTNPTEPTAPLEGGEGEATDGSETSTPVPDVPLPSNWQGKDELWSKVPADLREPLRAMQEELHQRQSQMGRELAGLKPLGETLSKYSEYFDGRAANYKPAEAVDFLFGLQRSMDTDPAGTLLQIADTYGLRPQLAQMFGGSVEGSQTNESALLAKISSLENHIRSISDPSRIDERINTKLMENQTVAQAEEIMSRVSKDIPLASSINPSDLVFFIEKSWAKLGDTATQEAVLRSAYDMAINADPELRVRAAALKTAAASDPDRIAAAKRANATNIKSTSTGKARELTPEEELGQIWDKNQRG